MNEVKVASPKISEETKKRIVKFFLQHTVPLILADEKKKGETNEPNNNSRKQPTIS